MNVIYRFMNKNTLKTHYKNDYTRYDDTKDDLICSLYLDGFSTTEIGKAVGISHRGVLNHLEHCNIPKRTLQESELLHYNKTLPQELQNYDSLYDLYIKQRKSKKELGTMFNVDPGTIDTCLCRFNIPVRNSSEAHMGINTGNKHPNWQGGITTLVMRLREAFNV